MIPELLKSIAGTFARWALTGLAGYLVSKNVIKGPDAESVITLAGIGLSTLVWGIYQKYKDRLKFLVALSMPAGSSEQQVKQEVKMGNNGLSMLSLLLLFSLLPVTLATSSCNEDQLKAIASNVDRIAILVQDGREVRDELFVQNLIDKDEAFRVTLGLQKVNSALKTFNDRARTYKATGDLSPAAKTDLKKLATDISSAAVELISNGTFGVKNSAAQSKINAAIGSVQQVALALIDVIDKLKPSKATPTPTPKQAGFPLAILPLLLLAIRQIMGFVDAEKARTGKTAEEIFDEAGVKLNDNDAALIEDLVKYAPDASTPPDTPGSDEDED